MGWGAGRGAGTPSEGTRCDGMATQGRPHVTFGHVAVVPQKAMVDLARVRVLAHWRPRPAPWACPQRRSRSAGVIASRLAAGERAPGPGRASRPARARCAAWLERDARGWRGAGRRGEARSRPSRAPGAADAAAAASTHAPPRPATPRNAPRVEPHRAGPGTTPTRDSDPPRARSRGHRDRSRCGKKKGGKGTHWGHGKKGSGLGGAPPPHERAGQVEGR